MKAMILAAGHGKRMRPLTDDTPKPLLRAGGKPLIEHQIEKLLQAGFSELVINLAYLGEQIEQQLGDGTALGVSIRYSHEPQGALETAGGIAKALPLLGCEPFLVVNGDVFHDYPLDQLPKLNDSDWAHLVLVPNPEHNPEGDFSLRQQRVTVEAKNDCTFSGIGIYRPELFEHLQPGQKAPLGPLLKNAIAQQRVSGELHRGLWLDVGTPERLSQLDDWLKSSADNAQ